MQRSLLPEVCSTSGRQMSGHLSTALPAGLRLMEGHASPRWIQGGGGPVSPGYLWGSVRGFAAPAAGKARPRSRSSSPAELGMYGVSAHTRLTLSSEQEQQSYYIMCVCWRTCRTIVFDTHFALGQTKLGKHMLINLNLCLCSGGSSSDHGWICVRLCTSLQALLCGQYTLHGRINNAH